MRSIIVNFLIFNLAILANVFGQTNQNNSFLPQQISGQPFINSYLAYDHSPFFKDNWVKGSVTLNSGIEFNDLNLKFDMFQNKLIYFNTYNKAMVIIDDDIIESFKLTDDLGETEVFKKISIDKNDARKDKYYSIIVEDSITLVVLYEAFIDNYTSANPGTKKIGSFENKKHFLYLQNHELHALPRFRPALFRLFPDIKSELKTYVRKNHLKVHNKSDLNMIFIEINRLNKIEKI
jgi:hypothetical protein